jgi:hypothetical protein
MCRNKLKKRKEGKATPVTARGGPQGCDKSRLSHFLESRLTYGGEVVSPTRRPPFTPQEVSRYSFLLRGWVEPRAIVRPEWLGKLSKNLNASEN